MPSTLSSSLSTSPSLELLNKNFEDEVYDLKTLPKIFMLRKESAQIFVEENNNSSEMTELIESDSDKVLDHTNTSSTITSTNKAKADHATDEELINHFSVDFPAQKRENAFLSPTSDPNEKHTKLLEIKREQQVNSKLAFNRVNVNRQSQKHIKTESEILNSIESSETSLNLSNMSSTESSFVQVNDKLVHRGLQTDNSGKSSNGGNGEDTLIIQSFDSSRRSSHDVPNRSPRNIIKKIK